MHKYLQPLRSGASCFHWSAVRFKPQTDSACQSTNQDRKSRELYPTWSFPQSIWRSLRPWNTKWSGSMKRKIELTGLNAKPHVCITGHCSSWCTETSLLITCSTATGPQTQVKGHLPREQDPKHTAKITKEWLRYHSVNVLEWFLDK